MGAQMVSQPARLTGSRGDRTLSIDERAQSSTEVTQVLRGPWRPSPAVSALERQSPEQRATLLAGAFAIASAVWAPLGIVLFLQRRFTLFLLLTLVAAVLLLAPRPRLLGAPGALRTALGEVGAVMRPFLREVRDASGEALGNVRAGTGPAVRAAGTRTATAMAVVRERGAQARDWTQVRLDELGSRARVRAAAWREAGERAGARSTSGDLQLTDPLSRWIGG